jgi:small subunit ribosomal protein S17
MADDEKTEIEETEETPAEVEAEAPAEEVSDTTETVDEAPAAEEVSDTGSEETEAEAPAPEEPAAEEEAAPAAPAKKQRSRRHVPRAERRTRTKVKRESAAKRKPITRLPKPESDRGSRQERRGVVVSDKGEKTIIVKVDVIKLHPRYKKVVRRSVKFHAHDEGNTAGVGDTVRIVETRPLSKTKRWRLAEIVEKAK